MAADKPTLYIETSVVSYQVARPSRDVLVLAHQEITWEWWQESLPLFAGYVSPIVLEEAGRGDPQMARRRLDLLKDFPALKPSDEVERVASMYMNKLPIPGRAFGDAVHLAFASVYGIEYLVTWNCAHIANAMIRRRLEIINSQGNLSTPVICTPEELVKTKEIVDD